MYKWLIVVGVMLSAPSWAQPVPCGPRPAAAASVAPAKVASSAAPKRAPELLKARAAILKKRWKTAQKTLTKLVAEHPEDGVAQATLAHVLMVGDKAQHPQALEHFTLAAKLLPNSPEVHYGRGVLFVLMGQPNEAKKERVWLAGQGHPLGSWLLLVIQDGVLADPLRGVPEVPYPKKKRRKGKKKSR